MFNPVRMMARPMLASMFVMGGLDALQNAEQKVPKAQEVAPRFAGAVPGLADLEPEDLVRINGAAQVAGGIALALGKLPRLSSAVLAASLVPTTLAGHRFWDETDAAARTNQKIHFVKNVSMLGGLLLSLLDTEGRPGIAWRAKHGVEHASHRADDLRRELELTKRKLLPDLGAARRLVRAGD